MTILKDDKVGGDARIEGTRIAVYHAAQYRDAGFDPEEIPEEFDLAVGDVKASLE